MARNSMPTSDNNNNEEGKDNEEETGSQPSNESNKGNNKGDKKLSQGPEKKNKAAEAEEDSNNEDENFSSMGSKRSQSKSPMPPIDFVKTLVGQIKIPSKFYNATKPEEKAEKPQLTGYLHFKVDEYKKSEYASDDILEYWVEDFGYWTISAGKT
jgi:hypothetical protein